MPRRPGDRAAALFTSASGTVTGVPNTTGQPVVGTDRRATSSATVLNVPYCFLFIEYDPTASSNFSRWWVGLPLYTLHTRRSSPQATCVRMSMRTSVGQEGNACWGRRFGGSIALSRKRTPPPLHLHHQRKSVVRRSHEEHPFRQAARHGPGALLRLVARDRAV